MFAALRKKAADRDLGKNWPSAKWFSIFKKLLDNSIGGFARPIGHNEGERYRKGCPDSLKGHI